MRGTADEHARRPPRIAADSAIRTRESPQERQARGSGGMGDGIFFAHPLELDDVPTPAIERPTPRGTRPRGPPYSSLCQTPRFSINHICESTVGSPSLGCTRL